MVVQVQEANKVGPRDLTTLIEHSEQALPSSCSMSSAGLDCTFQCVYSGIYSAMISPRPCLCTVSSPPVLDHPSNGPVTVTLATLSAEYSLHRDYHRVMDTVPLFS